MDFSLRVQSLEHIALKNVLKQRIEYLSQFRGKNIIIHDLPEVINLILGIAFRSKDVSAVKLSERSIVLIVNDKKR